VTKARVYLTDLELRYLRAMPGGAGQSAEMLSIDSTAAGHAYRTMRIHGGPAGDNGSRHRPGFRWLTGPSGWGLGVDGR
jgi:hypothetical protein